MVLALVMNSIFTQTITQEVPFVDNSDFEYKLHIIEKGIEE